MSESLGRPNNEWCGWSVDYAGAAEFTQFLQKKGAPESNVLIWADYKDWLVLPADLRKEIMSWDIVFDIDVTRSFPHDWTFEGRKGSKGKKVKAEWTGPPQEFYRMHEKTMSHS